MCLVIVVLILLVWAEVGIKEGLMPSATPIENLDEHTRYFSSLPNQKAR